MTHPNGSTSPSGEKHPGEIVFDDKVSGRVTKTPASSVPQSMAWAQDGNGTWVAVVRIEATGTKQRREITKFGADGAFLESTVQR